MILCHTGKAQKQLGSPSADRHFKCRSHNACDQDFIGTNKHSVRLIVSAVLISYDTVFFSRFAISKIFIYEKLILILSAC